MRINFQNARRQVVGILSLLLISSGTVRHPHYYDCALADTLTIAAIVLAVWTHWRAMNIWAGTAAAGRLGCLALSV